MLELHIDIETYSSVDIKESGAYKYVESEDFEILMIAYSLGEREVKIIDLKYDYSEEDFSEFRALFKNKNILKIAHNATFERLCFNAEGLFSDPEEWECSAIKAAYCGLPLSLGDLSIALDLKDKGKLEVGKDAIKYFCVPVKPTKANSGRTRNYPKDNPTLWEKFKEYCCNDVEAEREIMRLLSDYTIPYFERTLYIVDQKINDFGIHVDLDMAKKATMSDALFKDIVRKKLINITGVKNPKSPAQIKKWIGEAIGKEVKSLAKTEVPKLLSDVGPGFVRNAINLRQKLSKSSTTKYQAMIKGACADGKLHGLLQFYGANRTGRWAGRLVQVQNLPRNNMKGLGVAREIVKLGNFDALNLAYDNVSNVLSELIRTAFIAPKGMTFAVADYSAIEARVLAWLAGEKWRLDVFETHGKIYEASAAVMFGVDISEVTKGSSLRTKGKIAELALGYQGSEGAMKRMGAEDMGLSDHEIKNIVKTWRRNNPNIRKFWDDMNIACIRSVKHKAEITLPQYRGLEIKTDSKALMIKLPSGRSLFYQSPSMTINKFGSPSIQYKNVDQVSKKWWSTSTYGGKLVENITQAVARDLLGHALVNLSKNNVDVSMHVHDEVVVPIDIINSEQQLSRIIDLMTDKPAWAKGLPLDADGYVTPFYKKD